MPLLLRACAWVWRAQSGLLKATAPNPQVSDESKALIRALLQKDPKARLPLDKARGADARTPAMTGNPAAALPASDAPSRRRSQVLEHPWILANAHPSGFPDMD